MLPNEVLKARLVSTHSRPKAAAWRVIIALAWSLCFNTQPPEGGCCNTYATKKAGDGFQHTAARRRLQKQGADQCLPNCFNTQPPEGGCLQWGLFGYLGKKVSTHSRPKAAACSGFPPLTTLRSFNTQPPEGGCLKFFRISAINTQFQHTAARRRLRYRRDHARGVTKFQHTAARRRLLPT